METEFTYNEKVTLHLPPAFLLKSINVQFTIQPADAGALIYGRGPDGVLKFVEVRNSPSPVSLPFCEPEIFIKYLGGLKEIIAMLVGYETRAG